MPNIIYSRPIHRYVSHVHKRVLKLVNFEVRKVQKPGVCDLETHSSWTHDAWHQLAILLVSGHLFKTVLQFWTHVLRQFFIWLTLKFFNAQHDYLVVEIEIVWCWINGSFSKMVLIKKFLSIWQVPFSNHSLGLEWTFCRISVSKMIILLLATWWVSALLEWGNIYNYHRFLACCQHYVVFKALNAAPSSVLGHHLPINRYLIIYVLVP